MEVEPETPASVSTIPQSYTILRIKRKRNEEPLDALVVESRVRRKKSRGGIGVFQYAQTVENDAWQDEKRQKDIQDQISKLARESTDTKQMTSGTSSPTTSRQQKEDAIRRYTILKQDDTELDRKRLPLSPPKVISSKDMPPKALKPDFRMYDAVLANEKPAPPLDPEMEKFLPMLNDYLKLHDIALDSDPPKAPGSETVGSSLRQTMISDDYVWDVFYHRPATLSEWNEAANVGMLSGLPPSITDPYDSASDSEEEDEADEDSNAEEYYKNDYPDSDDPSDDSAGSDGFHEDSDHDDMIHYDDDGDDHDWR